MSIRTRWRTSGRCRGWPGLAVGGRRDLNPKADGPERREYIEHIVMEPIDPQAERAAAVLGLRYHIHINTPEEDITFHDQVGYWLWEPATGLIIQTLSIPRGQVAIAGGQAQPGDDRWW